jgi:hypothetical protein
MDAILAGGFPKGAVALSVLCALCSVLCALCSVLCALCCAGCRWSTLCSVPLVYWPLVACAGAIAICTAQKAGADLADLARELKLEPHDFIPFIKINWYLE